MAADAVGVDVSADHGVPLLEIHLLEHAPQCLAGHVLWQRVNDAHGIDLLEAAKNVRRLNPP
jgi:hypothetical protein